MQRKNFFIILLIALILVSSLIYAEKVKKKAIKVHHTIIGDGMPIIMLHDFGTDHRQMMGCMEKLFEKRPGWKRVYIDLPGMGKSEGKDWIKNSAKILQIVSSLINNIVKDQEFVLVGHGYGAYLIRPVSHEHSNRLQGMLLIAPLTKVGYKDKKLPKKTVLSRTTGWEKDIPKEDLALFRSKAVIQNHAVWERFKEEVLPGMKEIDQNFLLRLRARGYALDYDLSTVFFVIDKPVLIICGRNDHVNGFQGAYELLDDFPRASISILDSAGPLVQIEREELFNILVSKWLDRIEKRWEVKPPEKTEQADEVIEIE